ncbi:MAG: peptide-methionine (S)-S-oxide reductase MsrA [Magnetococcales bacterium]|nr:peptide-methionine (S)-S-oxide reductase MsrA [Magnetococcales bacterium]
MEIMWLFLGLGLGIPGMAQGDESKLETATFAGGCFWCVEQVFDEVEGVVKTTSGYIGGSQKNPTYREVSRGKTGHAEAVEVVFDPAKVSYDELLAIYWRNIDPTTPDRQFCDRGSQYRAEIFYHNDEQLNLAQASLSALMEEKPFDGAIVTQITPASDFYPAEAYHQNFHRTNPLRYTFYKSRCGRDNRLEELWGKK